MYPEPDSTELTDLTDGLNRLMETINQPVNRWFCRSRYYYYYYYYSTTTTTTSRSSTCFDPCDASQFSLMQI
jgi:hypothetical protein